MRKSNKYYKLLFYFIIPLGLFAFWIFFPIIVNKNISFSTVVVNEQSSAVKQLESGRRLVSEFKAKENNLGMILLGINVYSNNENDLLSFKIREKTSNQWQYTNSYNARLISGDNLFPIGFPVIKNSKGKQYLIELDAGKNDIDLNNKGFITGYKFTKADILSDKTLLFAIVARKVLLNFENSNFFLSNIIYLTPLFLYVLIFLSSPYWKSINFRKLIVLILGLFIIQDIFLIPDQSLGILLILFFTWIYVLFKMKIHSKYAFVLFFIITVIWIIFTYLNIRQFENKLNIWAYLFLLSGVFKVYLETIRSLRKKAKVTKDN